MIEIPASVQIKTTLKKGSLYYFVEDKFESKKPHYFIVLNKKPLTDDFLVLVCASSKVEKRKRIISKLGIPLETLVEVSPKECLFLKQNSIFDCNSVIEKSLQSLVEKLDQGKLKVCKHNVSSRILESLIKSVLLSPQVSRLSQELIKDA